MHFLSEDHEVADKELRCMNYCLEKAVEHIMQGDYSRATAYTENVLRSMKELQRLNDKKQHHEKVKRLVDELKDENIKVMIVRRKIT